MKALLKNYHQSPRKVRLVADLIRGKSVPAARAALLYLPKKSSPTIGKLLDSAIANASSRGNSAENLFVKTITVNKGAVMRRARPFGRGRSGTLRKTMSIVFLELGVSARKVAKAAKNASPKKSNRKVQVSKKQTKELQATS
ncbi:50S ribosomal protein L22 [Candidatus Kaiserbacteria bacterium RIFCSPHIGHO2_02_FULL_55_20]|uniref:Large ribosomal subunit protein uL22 n=1 Tax=Candidatus Kaiserbacteria bacterium RIFCSPHIGHO2_02_FULL_55_20 TaxID=1798497 RepID=A0A1F6DX14_9BACT|nr:MAG: 50S ribosomal protein L22 [Candidatus Kaiserbacteria bacterium RIFCSPHIGHO2_01_FULL_55_37]OGG65958.1 MAG: 50S ribosomal protein L22 [Candidatus Kaiserbacteria bacterium RIFCSPHIGHO2_02_FULL_55_20]